MEVDYYPGRSNQGGNRYAGKRGHNTGSKRRQGISPYIASTIRVTERTLTLDDDWQVLADKAQDIMVQKKMIELVGTVAQAGVCQPKDVNRAL